MSEIPPGHVIVCGMGYVGYRIVVLLRRLGVPVTVVTHAARAEWRRDAEDRGVRLLLGDARDAALLAEAGLPSARALIAATDQDVANVEIALDAKKARKDLPVVIRLFDQHLARQMEASFDIRRAFAVSALAAPTFAAAAAGERRIGSFALDGAAYVIGRLSPAAPTTEREIAEGSGLQPLAEGPFPAGSHVTVVGLAEAWNRAAPSPSRPPVRAREPILALGRRAWKESSPVLRTVLLTLLGLIGLSIVVFRFALHLSFVDAFYFVVTTVTTVGYGDITPLHSSSAVKLYVSLLMVLGSATLATLFSLITDALVTARFREALGRQRVPEEGHVVVVGLGNVGYRIVEELRRAGEAVVAVDRDPESEFAGAVRGLGAVVTGDSRLPETLHKAGVPRARAVVAVTHDDAVNLGVALAARRMRPDVRTVVRLFDPEFARKVQEAFHVDAALSASLLAAPAFVAAALHPGVLAAFVEDGRFFVLLRGDAAGLRPTGARPLLFRSPGESAFRPVSAAADAPEAEWVAVVSRPLD